jgi:hypothetical protein
LRREDPKKLAVLPRYGGKVSIEETRKSSIAMIAITNQEDGEVRTYQIPYSAV